MTQRDGGGVEGDLDALFATEPAEFVRARDELVRRLRKEGERDAAAEVAKLRRPTAVAWALNQLSRREGGQVDALLRQDERLRALMQSGGRGAELRKASDERREIVRDLARVAAAILAGAGHAPAPASNEKIFETLQAVATDAAAAEALRAGRLTGDVRPSGFGEGGFGEAVPAEGAGGGEEAHLAREAGAARRLADARRAARELAEEAGDLRRRSEQLSRTADEAERQARRARKEADRAASEADRAAATADDAARAVAELEGDEKLEGD